MMASPVTEQKTAANPKSLNTNGFGVTQRTDSWWVEPFLTLLALGSFGIYATWRAFEGDFSHWGNYLSPMYSPEFDFGWWKWSPALLILWVPAGFRATCYYYRKAYYRAFFWDPPACAVGEPRAENYQGETKFPFLLQNLHRYFFYLAALYIFILGYDALMAFNFDGQFGVGLGSIIMVVNVVFLALYTFSCHSWRHLIGGNVDCFSCAYMGHQKHEAWSRQSVLNEKHMLWAWISLFTVWGTDLYIRLGAAGLIQDMRLL